MRNIYIKTAAFILSLVFAVIMVYTGCVTVLRYCESYDFAESFEKSSIPQGYLLHSIYIDGNFDGIDYYIKSADTVYTNTGISDRSYYENAPSQANLIDKKSTEAIITNEWKVQNCEIYAKLTNEKYEQLKTDWLKGATAVSRAINVCIIYLVGMIAAAVYLLWTCGRKNSSDDVHMLLIDRLPTEITLALCALSVSPLIGMLMALGECDAAVFGAQADIIAKGISFGAAVSYALVLTFLMSLVRCLKSRTFLKQSLIYKCIRLIFRVIKFCWNLFVKIVKKIFSYIKKCNDEFKRVVRFILRGNREILLFIGYSAAVFILTMIFTLCIDGSWFWPFILLAASVIFAVRYVYRRISGFERVCEGARIIRGGDVGYVIPEGTDSRTNELAQNINRMADGLRESLKREVQAERMKSELITNVSHDLKTPLTAIINYADLLSELELTPAEANDYASVIKKKGERLKRLTSDLFDISKAQSGGEQVTLEKIDLALLMRQSLGETNESIINSGLDFRINIPENEVNVTADGKKLSRVFENLIQNILKYSMEKSRVYVSLTVREDKAYAEFKNISAVPMDFDGDYITERFVRGDKSRSGDGSGLGLAIAKSYTELCGGSFKVTVDGDLFKACVVFDMIKQ